MSEILLKASEARDAAGRVRDSSANAQEEFDSLKSFLGGLSDSFRGKTAAAFEAEFDNWKNSANQLNEALHNLGQFLGDAATAIEGVDDDLASRLGGG